MQMEISLPDRAVLSAITGLKATTQRQLPERATDVLRMLLRRSRNSRDQPERKALLHRQGSLKAGLHRATTLRRPEVKAVEAAEAAAVAQDQEGLEEANHLF